MIEQIEVYQKIADELVRQLPTGWESCEAKIEIDEDLAGFYLHCFRQSQELELDLTEALDDYFRELWCFSKKDNRGPWKKCTYVLTPDGNFTTDFDYDAKLSWED